jgi:hypothetical protein
MLRPDHWSNRSAKDTSHSSRIVSYARPLVQRENGSELLNDSFGEVMQMIGKGVRSYFLKLNKKQAGSERAVGAVQTAFRPGAMPRLSLQRNASALHPLDQHFKNHATSCSLQVKSTMY